MTTEAIEAVRLLHQFWSTGEQSLATKIYAPDFVAHWPPSAAVPTRRGIDAIRTGMAALRTAFPDWTETIQDIFAAGDRVGCRYRGAGTHLGTFNGLAPTQRRVEIQEISIFRVVDGLVVEQWCMFDELARLQQLGASETYLARMLKLV